MDARPLGEKSGGKGPPRTARFSAYRRPTVPTDREIYYSPEVREQTLAIAWIWHSGIYGLNVVYALVASLVRKVQDPMLIKLKAGIISHMPQGMWLPTENPN